MKMRLAIAVLLGSTFGLAGCANQNPSPSGRVHLTFDDVPIGSVPPGWHIGQTSPTRELATWEVVPDRSVPVDQRAFALVRSDNYDGTFNLAIDEDTSFRDLGLSVRVMAVRGEEDQGGGPIWRCQDENNYYICRINPLESNYRVYVVSNGKRRQLDSAKVELEAERWYDVRVRMVGNQITCYLDGKPMLTATDDTIQVPGRIGLWTKADAVTSFDDLTAEPIAGEASQTR